MANETKAGTETAEKAAEKMVAGAKPGRKERVPLGILRQKLKADQREGYSRRWINDKPGRLDDAVAAGYEFVKDPDNGLKIGEGNDVSQIGGVGSVVSRIVGQHEDGRPMKAYLMEVDKDLWDEDQAAKMQALDEKEASIQRGQDDQGRPGRDGRYVPTTGIKIDHGHR